MLFGTQKLPGKALAGASLQESIRGKARNEGRDRDCCQQEVPIKNPNKISREMVGCREGSQSHSENRN